MGIKNGVFGLEDVYSLQIDEEWTNKSEVFLDGDTSKTHTITGWNYGYWLGGNSKSTFRRLDFSNDTEGLVDRVIIPAAISPGYRPLTTFGSPTKGYFVSPGNQTMQTGAGGNMLAFSYASDTSIVVPGGSTSMPGPQPYGQSAFNTNYAYTASNSYIERHDFSNDTGTGIRKHTLGDDRKNSGVTANQSYWYMGGGGSPAKSSMERLDFSNDTAALAPKGPLTVARGAFAGATGNADYGWWFGAQSGNTGWTGSGSLVDRLDFSNDSASCSPRGNLSPSVSLEPADAVAGNDFTAYIGGYHPSGNIQKINYANDTATPSSTLIPSTFADVFTSGFSIVQYGLPKQVLTISGPGPQPFGHSTGYFAGGGDSNPFKSTVERIDYSNDTATAVEKGSLSTSTGRRMLAGSSSSEFGYFGGGGNPALAQYSIVDRIDYSNDTGTASPKGPLGQQKHSHGATGNGNFGYFGGGSNHLGPRTTSIFRIEYFNDTATAVQKGSLSAGSPGVKELTATGNRDFGYFMGGETPSAISTTDRLDYSSDTTNCVAKGPLSGAKKGLSSTGNKDFAYIGGGSTPSIISTVDRLDYASDTIAATPKGPLSVARRLLAATGDANFGYFGGGNAPGNRSTVDRIDYSNDTVSASPKGSLSEAKQQLGATSSHHGALPTTAVPFPEVYNFATNVVQPPNFAVLTQPGNSGTNLIKYDFASNTTSLLSGRAHGNHNSGRHQYASSNNHAYFVGQYTQGSLVQRVDYADDSSNTLFRANLPSVMYNAGSSFNTSYAWFAGGLTPNRTSNTTRLDYANDLTAPAPKGDLTLSRDKHAGTGNQNYGYHSGGATAPADPTSTTDRIDYSNDTAAATPKGPLTSARRYFGASSNADFGYWAGGDSGSSHRTRVDRLDFSNDTATAITKAFISQPSPSPGNQMAGFGSDSAAYFFGGSPSNSSVERLDYASDTFISEINLYASNPASLAFSDDKGASARQNGNPVNSVLKNDYSNSPQFGFPAANFVYFGGGSPGGGTINKYNTFNDTGGLAAPLNAVRSDYGGATGNNFFGYFFAGAPGESRFERLDYANDLAAPAFRGTLDTSTPTFSHSYGAATGSADVAYFIPGYYTNVQRIDYSNDTATGSQKGKISIGRYLSPGHLTGNQNFGYYIGGFTGSTETSVIDRIDYSNDTAAAAPKGSLTDTRREAATSSNANYAYLGGGNDPSTSRSNINRLDFSNDTNATISKGALNSPSGQEKPSATGDGAMGYFWQYNESLICRLDYSNDTGNVLPRSPSATTGLPRIGQYASGVSSMEKGLDENKFPFPIANAVATNFGYFMQPNGRSVARIDYTNDTETGRAAPSPAGILAGNHCCGNSSQTYGYIANGQQAPSSALPGGQSSLGSYNGIVRFDYQNDLFGIAYRSQLFAGNYGSPGGGAAVSNTNYGYWAGGWNLSGPLAPSPVDGSSAVNRLDYANDTTDCIIRGNLDIGTNDTSACGNASSAYFMGGSGSAYTPGSVPGAGSQVQRMDYSNDNVTWSLKGLLDQSRQRCAATGNASYGYVAGNNGGNITSLSRVDYSNDTAQASPKGPLPTAFQYTSATGNTSFGYFTGLNNSTSTKTTVYRLDYSSDTSTASPKGPLGSDNTSRPNQGFSAAANALPQ